MPEVKNRASRLQRRSPRVRNLDTFIAMAGKTYFDENLSRVDRLIEIYRSIPGHVVSRRSINAADVLRAAVVLLHASLEDLLRQIARHRIPLSGEQTLDEIPLKGMAGRAEKFSLGKLAAFRDKTVDDLISESVATYYDSAVTFNNVRDISLVLEQSRIKQDSVRRFYPLLASMMQRRHQIVHRGDLTKREAGGRTAEKLNAKTVTRWKSNTQRFGDKVLELLAGERVPGF
jgi:hypothetical protein